VDGGSREGDDLKRGDWTYRFERTGNKAYSTGECAGRRYRGVENRLDVTDPELAAKHFRMDPTAVEDRRAPARLILDA